MYEEGVTRWQSLEPSWLTVLASNNLEFPFELQIDLQRVFVASDFVAQQAIQRPDTLFSLLEQGLLARARRPGEMAEALVSNLAGCVDETSLASALRHFRNREMVRIIWRDLTNLAPLAETLEELSELADICVQQALAKLSGWAIEKDGVPQDLDGNEQSLLVLGMGKLGARELNLSSDVDLIFCFAAHGHTSGRRALENETFFTRLGQRLINVLSKQTADGFVFRVDMRLRPFGDSGPLVASFGAMEQYYQSQAREWERYAMVKARAITGSVLDKSILQGVLSAFVFRRYIDFGVIEAIREMKHMIVRELRHKGLDDNIKLGMGGIREIEFIGQAFQLVRGGRDRDLQVRPIQEVLDRLQQKALLPEYAVNELQAAYVFLRRAENRLQAWRDEQTHVLPTDEARRLHLAQSMGFDDWDEFNSTLMRHRQHVQSQFEQVFEAPQAEQQSTDSLLANAWLLSEASDEQCRLIEAAGFTDAETALQEIRVFRESVGVRMLSAQARVRLDRLMPLALEAIVAYADPDNLLLRFLRLLETIVRRTAYIDLLLSNPLALSQLLHLLSESVWVGSQLARQPILLDELLDPRRLYSPMHADELQHELAVLLDSLDVQDQEQEMERLRQFALGNRLRVAAADLTGVIPLMVVSGYLTEIAEISLQQVQRSAWRDMTARYGQPQLENMHDGLAVIGYGKMGGIELGYASDLDLVFLHGSRQATAMTDGDRAVANDVFYARMGQRMVHMLNTRMSSGQLYEVDMRLRPNGNSGMLVSSLNAFEHYQMKEAWTWEHQALIRARAVSGDPAVIRRFQAIRKNVLCRPRDEHVLRKDVREMREKMAAKLDASSDTQFDIKQGAGGLVDIEFLVQYAVLRWAHEYPDLIEWTDNARLLDALQEHRLLAGTSAELLFGAYSVFRAISHRRALQEEKAIVRQDELGEERSMVRDIWQQMMTE